MKLSIVATLYQSAPHLEEFYDRARKSAQKLVGNDFEIVFVNDGSPDNSLDLAVEFSQNDKHVIVVDLSRNFGHHKAMMTGLAYAKGEKVFLIDCDLEEDPEWLLSFNKQAESESCDVVYGVQKSRKGQLFERWSGQLFYNFLNVLTSLKLPENIVTSRLMTRRYVDALLLHREREVFLAGIWHITGFLQSPQIVTKQNTSQTTYTLSRKISIFVNSVTSFSSAPLKGIFYLGTLIFLLSLIYVVYLITNKFFWAVPLSGWTSVMASVWLLGGLIISFIGIIGIYLSKVFVETKQRPYTIVRQIYGKK